MSLPSQIHTIFLSPGMHCRHPIIPPKHPIIKNIERHCNTHTLILPKGNIKLSHFLSHSLSVTLFQKHRLIPYLTSLFNYYSFCLAHILPLYFSQRRLMEFFSVLKLACTRHETCQETDKLESLVWEWQMWHINQSYHGKTNTRTTTTVTGMTHGGNSSNV